MTLKGRHWLLLWLLVFLGAASAVVARQRAALQTAQRLTELRGTRHALEARKADLERRIRYASSRAVLLPKVERMGLVFPPDSQTTFLALPGAPGRRR